MNQIKSHFHLVRQFLDELCEKVGTEHVNNVFDFYNPHEPWEDVEMPNSNQMEKGSHDLSHFIFKPTGLTVSWREWEDIGGWISSDKELEYHEWIAVIFTTLKSCESKV